MTLTTFEGAAKVKQTGFQCRLPSFHVLSLEPQHSSSPDLTTQQLSVKGAGALKSLQ
jgi:hypothetical protein